jgi:hypothetical protein
MEHARVIHGCCGEAHSVEATAVHACCGMSRRFVTKEERRESLAAYKDQLSKELAGVEERLAELG